MGACYDKRITTKVARNEVLNAFHHEVHWNEWYLCFARYLGTSSKPWSAWDGDSFDSGHGYLYISYISCMSSTSHFNILHRIRNALYIQKCHRMARHDLISPKPHMEKVCPNAHTLWRNHSTSGQGVIFWSINVTKIHSFLNGRSVI